MQNQYVISFFELSYNERTLRKILIEFLYAPFFEHFANSKVFHKPTLNTSLKGVKKIKANNIHNIRTFINETDLEPE